MVHGIRLRDGRAEWYRNRWVRSAEVARALGEEPRARDRCTPTWTSRPTPTSSGTPGARSPSSRPVHAPTSSTRSSTRSGPATSAARSTAGYTAHPKRDPLHRRALRRLLLLRVGRRRRGHDRRRAGARALLPARDDGRTGERARHAPSPSAHIVLLDLPVTFSMDAIAEGARFPYRWQEGYHARVGLLPARRRLDRRRLARRRAVLRVPPHERLRRARRRRDRARRRAPPLHVPHAAARSLRGGAHARALAPRRPWRRGQGGAPRRPGPGVPPRRRAPGRAAPPLRLRRRRRASPTTSSAPSRCCCATTSSGAPARSAPSGAAPAWARPSSCPAPPDADETDGWLMTLVHSAESGTSALHILNADDVDGEPQAVVAAARSGCRRASTATGCPTRPDLAGDPGPARPDRSTVRPDRPTVCGRSAHAGVGFMRVRLAMGPATSVAVGPRARLRDPQLRRRDGVGARVPHRVVAGGPARGAAHLPARADRQGAWPPCATGCRRPASTGTAPAGARASTSWASSAPSRRPRP